MPPCCKLWSCARRGALSRPRQSPGTSAAAPRPTTAATPIAFGDGTLPRPIRPLPELPRAQPRFPPAIGRVDWTATGSSPPQRVDHLAREIGLIGNDPSWRQVIDLAATIAATPNVGLDRRRAGNGQIAVARLIHAARAQPRAALHHRRGVGAGRRAVDPRAARDAVPEPGGMTLKTGSNKLAQAHGGTLYLDEVAALPLEFQLHLLRELQFRDYEATAGHPTPAGDARFLDVHQRKPARLDRAGAVSPGALSSDQRDQPHAPPLRHRGTDVELLAESFRAHYAREFHKTVAGFTRDALDVLQKHDWPGNVRELEAAVQRAVALCNGPRITSSHLAPILNHHRQSRAAGRAHAPTSPQDGRSAAQGSPRGTRKADHHPGPQAFNWNRQETARVLDINRTTLYKKMKKYNLLIDEPHLGSTDRRS